VCNDFQANNQSLTFNENTDSGNYVHVTLRLFFQELTDKEKT